MVRIAHLSDIHIFAHKHHEEFAAILDDLYTKLSTLRPDYIFVSGDVAHNKLNVSNEYFYLLTRFFDILTFFVNNSVHVILGNHDLNLSNQNRLNSISPVIYAFNGSPKYGKIYLHQNSGRFDIDNLTLGVFSISDKENWPIENNSGKIKIALFHGAINQASFDNNHPITDGVDLSLFKNYDFGMFGDIHQRQYLDQEKRFAYCGNLWQKSFGESREKGFLFWDIEDKDDYSSQFIEIKNPKPYYTLQLADDLKVPKNLNIEPDAHLRAFVPKEINILEEQEIKKEIIRIYQPDGSPAIIPNNIKTNKNFTLNEQEVALEDLRDLSVQEQLIKDFLKNETNLTDDILQIIFKLNKRFQEQILTEDEVKRNVVWGIDSFRFGNFFSFGEENSINLGNYTGLIGIVGPNFIGKSSIIDTLLIAITNNDSKTLDKGDRIKSHEYINENCDQAWVELVMNVLGEKYEITRKINRVFQGKRKNQLKEESNTTLKFIGPNEDLTGHERADTDKTIRKNFGSIHDIISTAISPQDEFAKFLKLGGTDRKEVLSRCLDLRIFEEKGSLAEKEFKKIRDELKKIGNKDFKKLLEQYEKDILNLRITIDEKTQEIHELDEKIKQAQSAKHENNFRIEVEEIKERQLKEKIEILDEVPCGDEYPTCPFIKDAFIAKMKLGELKERIAMPGYASGYTFLDPTLRLEQEKKIVMANIVSFSNKKGFLEKEIEELEKEQLRYEELKKSFLVYDLYTKTMNRDGLPFQIISSRIPLINQEINAVLSNMVKFKVYLQDNLEDKTLGIYIQYPKYHKRKIEFASGMEKFVASLAIRTALYKMMNLPKPNFMIIDEGFGSLDDNARTEISNVLNYMKQFFKAIFIISHQNDLKDMCDGLIEVYQDDKGYSKVTA